MLDVLKLAAQKAGRIQLKYFQNAELEITHKTNHENIVTKADKESQKAITASILQSLQAKGIEEDDIGFIGEEDLHTTGNHIFIIDPLDGTSNFATGMEEFAVLIAYYYKEVLQSGVMYFPVKNTWYVCEKGKGVQTIRHNRTQDIRFQHVPLDQSFLFSSLSYEPEIKAGIPQLILNLKPLFRAVRMYGCAANELAFILDGVAGATLLYGCSIWDIAPGLLMLREVGYELYDFDGLPLVLDVSQPTKTYPFIACHPTHKESIMKHMQKY